MGSIVERGGETRSAFSDRVAPIAPVPRVVEWDDNANRHAAVATKTATSGSCWRRSCHRGILRIRAAASRRARRRSLENALVAVGGLARVPSRIGRARLDSAPARSISLGIAIEPSRPAALSAYAAAVSTVGNPLFHRYLSASAFDTDFAPSIATVTRLESSLRALGFHVGALPADRLLLPVSASAGVVDRSLHTNLVKYRLPSGAIGWSASVAPELPRSVASGISAVVGLDNLTTSSTSISREDRVSAPETRSLGHTAVSTSPGACGAASDAARRSGGWTEADIAQAYGLTGLYGKGDLAAGQTIGIFELEPFLMSDVATFDRCIFGESHTSQISVQKLDGFDLSGPGEGEAALDVEEISALAPDARILVYEAPNTTFGALDEYAAMVSQDQANVISTSWGECEQALQVGAPDATQLENTLFEEAAIQGQTVFASAGDDGSDDCANTPFSSGTPVSPYLSVDDPGAQPYVISVGGTSLLSDRQPLGADGETVWNDGTSGGAGGGGLSSLWSIPEWQADLGVPGLATSGRPGDPRCQRVRESLARNSGLHLVPVVLVRIGATPPEPAAREPAPTARGARSVALRPRHRSGRRSRRRSQGPG